MKVLSALFLAVALVVFGAQGSAMTAAGAAAAPAASHCDDMAPPGGQDSEDDAPCMIGGHCDFCPAAAVFIPSSSVASGAFAAEIPYAAETGSLNGVASQPASPPPRA